LSTVDSLLLDTVGIGDCHLDRMEAATESDIHQHIESGEDYLELIPGVYVGGVDSSHSEFAYVPLKSEEEEEESLHPDLDFDLKNQASEGYLEAHIVEELRDTIASAASEAQSTLNNLKSRTATRS